MIIVDYIFYGGMAAVACGYVYLFVDFCSYMREGHRKEQEANRARELRK